MKRREFIIGAAAATGLASVSRGWTQNSNDPKKSRIAIMIFGLDSLVKNNFPPSPNRTIDIMDSGELCADRYGVHNIELQSNYFPSTEISWLKDFKARLTKTKTKIVQINLELGIEIGNGMQLTSDTPVGRLHMIDLHRAWFEKAAFLECPRVLINQGRPTQENKELAITNLKALVAIAKPFKIICASENRGGGGGGRGRAGGAGAPADRGGQPAQTAPQARAAAPPQPSGPSFPLLVEIMRAGGGYLCVDMVNFPNEDEQHDGIRAELPFTSGLLHADMVYDLPKAMAICRELQYKGIYSIKAMRMPGNPLESTQKIIDGVLETM
jgi:hypothetical protein